MEDSDRVNILLVDDQPAKLLSYEVILGELGENLIKANGGKEALELLLRNETAVVLVDVKMPHLDGFELTEMIRQHPRFQKTAIILVSAEALTDIDRLKGYNSGAVDYISVPIIPEILRAKVAVFADLYRKTKQLEQLNLELERRVGERTSALESSTASLRESEERFRNMADHAPVMVWVTESNGSTSYLSKSWYEFTGESLQPGSELCRMEVVHPEDRPRVQAALAEAGKNRGTLRIEYRMRGPESQYRWVIDSATPRFSTGGTDFLGHIGSIMDITERKEVEEERILLLESERAARNEAERLTRMKDEFLATLSHELRAPLTAILGWAQLLRLRQLDEKQMDKGLEIVERNALAQSHLVDDLFEINRVATGKIRLDLQPVEMNGILDSSIETIRPTAHQKKIVVQKNASVPKLTVLGDPGRLQQIFRNLLSNAVKFTPPGGRVNVDLLARETWVEVTVTDSGIGIEPEFLPHIFDRFRQGDSSITRKFGGLGLGLTIVKHLSELHGGEVTVKSAGKDQGAIFTMRIPAAEGAGETVRPLSSPYIPDGGQSELLSLKGLKILSVDDEEDTRSFIQRVLEEAEATVVSASSAQEALKLFQSQRPDLLVCDISMPGMDGYELIKAIRCLDVHQGATVPAVALTAFARHEDELNALHAGYHLHMAKPVEPFKLVAMISRLIKAKKNHSPIPSN